MKRIEKGLNYVEQQLFRASEASLRHARYEPNHVLPTCERKEGRRLPANS